MEKDGDDNIIIGKFPDKRGNTSDSDKVTQGVEDEIHDAFDSFAEEKRKEDAKKAGSTNIQIEGSVVNVGGKIICNTEGKAQIDTTEKDETSSSEENEKPGTDKKKMGIYLSILFGIAIIVGLLIGWPEKGTEPSRAADISKKSKVTSNISWPCDYKAGDPSMMFPKEINDGQHQKIYIHYNLNEAESANNLTLFLDTLYATHDNISGFTIKCHHRTNSPPFSLV